MIDVFDADTIRHEPELFEAMHRLRHRVFKERQGWEVDSLNGLEFDIFDTSYVNPVYFICRDPVGEVVATLRLLPTTGPNMLRDVFHQIMNGDPVPAREGLWELSRFAVDADPTTQAGLAAFNRYTAELLCALGEWGIPNGLDEVIAVYDIMIGRLLRRIGVRPLWMSQRRRIGKCVTVAATYEISDRELGTIRMGAGIEGDVVSRVKLNGNRVAA